MEIQHPYVLELAFRDPALVEGHEPVGADEAAGRPQFGRILGQDQVPARAVHAEHVRQLVLNAQIAVQRRLEARQLLLNLVSGIRELADQPLRHPVQLVTRGLDAVRNLEHLAARRSHERDQGGHLRAVALPGSLPDLDVVPGHYQPMVPGQREIRGRGDQMVGAVNLIPRRRRRPEQCHQGIARQRVTDRHEPALDVVEVRLQAIQGRPIEVRPHRFDVAGQPVHGVTQRQPVVNHGGVPDGAHDQEEAQAGERAQQYHVAAPAPPRHGPAARSVVPGSPVLRLPRARVGGAWSAFFGHCSGTAMTRNLGAVT